MNKMAKRLIAGASAVALLASSVGIEQLADLFMKTSFADSVSTSNRIGQSTGFNNLEQDTTKGNAEYNTGYGLHTNKTASIAEGTTDGRTFDVNLESWYVGENPVDVATILDASGSMAWTVDTLEPLTFDEKSMGSSVDALKTEYGISDDDLEKFTSYKGDLTRVLAAIQDKNGGYLPQNIVDKILDPTKTDNSKLSYADYMYYIYESRSTVSEFVPLGYWDGGEPADVFYPIGYYPFEGTLDNAIDNLSATKATLIAHPNSGESFNKTEITSVPASPTYSNGFVNLNTTAKNGAIALDVPLDESTTHQLSIVFDMQISEIGDSDDPYDETPILYISDGKSASSYLRIVKGNKRLAGTKNKGAAQKIRCYDSSNLQPSSDSSGGAVNESNSSRILDSNSDFKVDNTYTITYTFNYDTKVANLYYYNDGTLISKSGTIQSEFDFENLQILVGGNICADDKDDYRDTYIKNLKIYDTILSSSGATSSDNLIASYALDGSANSLVDSVDSSRTAKFVEQVNSDGSFDVGKTLADVPANVTYTSTKYKGDKALNLSETSKLGGILLDAKPKGNAYTISFAIRQKEPSDSTETLPTDVFNIMYAGMLDQNSYFQILKYYKDPRRIRVFEGTGTDSKSSYKAFENTDYKYITYVIDGNEITTYINGENSVSDATLTGTFNSSYENPNLILAGLLSQYGGSDIYIDDLYVFDEALDPKQVELVFKNAGQTKFAIAPDALTTGCKGYHATTSDGTKDIAQISESLAQNPEDGERKGWYYVNSHSTWADISDCLKSGKQYLGLINDFGLATYKDGITPDKLAPNGSGSGDVIKPEEGYADDNQSIATVPSVYQAAYESTDTSDNTIVHYKDLYNKLIAGNDESKIFSPSANERSIRFYVDSQGCLRCFYCTGDYSWKVSSSKWSYNPRTFCSVVYVKDKYIENKNDDGEVASRTGNATKYEELNYALNQFYQNLAKYSDLSNSAIVRFSTHNLIQGNSKDEVETNAVDHLKMLIMKDWTNYSDVYSKDKSARENYLQDLLIPTADETSTKTENSSARPDDILEYPYVMTGGTYTWTGLKAFYDNMVNTEKLSSGDTVYNIANDARDKYLIIFTDGRDNTIGSDDTKYVKDFTLKDKSKPEKGVESYGNFAPYNEKGKQLTLDKDADLAKAWADKLKDEGYTIFCVMLATGSISPTTNEEEYNKAYKFLEALAGDKDGERDVDDCISVVGVDNTLENAFADILTQIQLPRNDYTVQDYIDPRFDLVDNAGNLYKLGAGGNITIKNADGSTETHTVHNVIEELDTNPDMTAAQCQALGLAYTPRESHMVNRTSSTDMKGDEGTGYIYYDDVKDMYYLRWTDQIIPMENDAFDTNDASGNLIKDTSGNAHYLDVWSATIRLKAKDDFIGGNDILTNGNEAGENLVYSDATIENMDKGDNYKLYGFKEADLNSDDKVPYRKKLEALSGTDRKINAVDADGVSQAVYGNGIDIPSSGFPRTTVNVRLLKLDANNLNDVIYMGEVLSPTMMLADLETDYMTGSYYLQYLERYAYRVYGEDAGNMPLIELLNKWLKINERDVEAKTFTIPYIYLPDPEYDEDGKLAREAGGKVNIQNSTGASWKGNDVDFADLNLRDVTGFITYTWKRNDDGEEQQKIDENSDGSPIYDVTLDYVVKNTNQIVYNLQLKFTPLKEGALPSGFTLDNNFIIGKTGEKSDKFFNIVNGEFNDSGVTAWSSSFTRTQYLQAMIQEKHTYEPHVMYDGTAGNEKWKLIEEADKATALSQYTDDPQTVDAGGNKVTDSGVYDWDSGYKKVVGNSQLEGAPSDDVNNIKGFYTDTPDNVKLLDSTGETELTNDNGKFTGTADPVSLVANTTYTKDVVNAALALELFVDGKYLGKTDSKITAGKEFTFIARRSYEDPYNEPSYATEEIGADASEQEYKLTFTVKEIPTDTQPNEIYRVWATLTNVAVLDESADKYISIDTDPTIGTESIKSYLGYEKADALPIGTYVIECTNTGAGNNSLENNQFKIANAGTTAELTSDLYFQYLKIENDKSSYTYDRFPDSVYQESDTAAESTKDGEYLIWNDSTDNSKKNIAENNREKTTDTQTVTFYFGTVEDDTSGDKGVNRIEDKDKDYAKDRLGIIMLSADNNSLAISKKVDNTDKSVDKNRSWKFTVTVKPESGDATREFNDQNTTGFKLKWYKDDALKTVEEMYEMGAYTSTVTSYPETITFDGSGSTYTATIYLKHDEKVVIDGLPEGTWQVTEDLGGVFCTPHNNANGLDGDEWRYQNSAATNVNTLNPISQVDYVNEFPYELPSTGGSGIVWYIVFGTALTAVGVLLFAVLYFDRRKKAHK